MRPPVLLEAAPEQCRALRENNALAGTRAVNRVAGIALWPAQSEVPPAACEEALAARGAAE